MTQPLMQNQPAVVAGEAVSRSGWPCTFQAWGKTDAGAGAATILIQGSNNGGATWDTIGTITLTLGVSDTSDSFTSQDKYTKHRANVTAISGTGARVSVVRGA